jgi:hypothetical protein
MILCFGYYAVISFTNRNSSLLLLLCVIFLNLSFHRFFLSSFPLSSFLSGNLMNLFIFYFIVVILYSLISCYGLFVPYSVVSLSYRNRRLVPFFFLSLSLLNRFLLCCYWFISEMNSKTSSSSNLIAFTNSYFYSRAIVMLSVLGVIGSVPFTFSPVSGTSSIKKFWHLLTFWNLSILIELFLGFKNSLLVLILQSLMVLMLSLLKTQCLNMDKELLRDVNINLLLSIGLSFWERLLYFLTSHAMKFSFLQVNGSFVLVSFVRSIFFSFLLHVAFFCFCVSSII